MDSKKRPRIRIRMVLLGATIIFSVGAAAIYLGAEPIRGNQQPKGSLRDALKKEGKRLIDRGRGKSHKTQR